MARILSPSPVTTGSSQPSQLAADVNDMSLDELMDLTVGGRTAAAGETETPNAENELEPLPPDLTTLSLEQLMSLSAREGEPEEEEDKEKDDKEVVDETVEAENPGAEDSGETRPHGTGGGAGFTSFEAVVLAENLLFAETSARDQDGRDETFATNVQTPSLAPLIDALPSPIPLDEESDTIPLALTEPAGNSGTALSLMGGPGEDFLIGGPGDDSIHGLGGDDHLEGAGGDDILDGGANSDTVSGGNGDDLILGGGGNDYLEGGAGNDTLDGGPGKDAIFAGDGDDVLVWDFPDTIIDGGAGLDTLRVIQGDVDIDRFKGSIFSIERIDLGSDSDPNSLTLNPQDILDISDADLLTVLGDNSDSVDAGSGWTYTGRNAEGQDVYIQNVSGSIATLVLDPDLNVNPDIVS